MTETLILPATAGALGALRQPGSGRPLVILPGWGTDSEFMLALAGLFPEREILIPDLPGVGLSRDLAAPSHHVIEDVARMLSATLPRECDLIAWSLSSLFALSLAATEPHRIHSLITVCGTPRFPGDPNWPGMPADLIVKSRKLLNLGNAMRILRLFLRLQSLDKTLNHTGFSQLVNKLMSRPRLIDRRSLLWGIDLMAMADLREELKHLEVPTLMMFGRRDRLVPADLVPYIPKLSGRLTMIFEHSAHVPFISEPEAFRRAVDDFHHLTA